MQPNVCLPKAFRVIWNWICSVIHNTLLKSSANFYPQPSHTDNIVGICLMIVDFVPWILKAAGQKQIIRMQF